MHRGFDVSLPIIKKTDCYNMEHKNMSIDDKGRGMLMYIRKDSQQDALFKKFMQMKEHYGCFHLQKPILDS